jgi:transcriptional regulator with XRE-family HTH domain
MPYGRVITEEQLRALLRKRLEYFSQKQMAEICSVSAATMSDWIHGRRRMSARIADFLGYRPQLMFVQKEGVYMPDRDKLDEVLASFEQEEKAEA